MDEERYPALPWQGWKIVKRLGRGGYGSVYLAQRNSAGVMEDAAVKVISFPKNEEDIEADFTDGYDLVSVRNKYKNMLHRYVDEYQIMLAFKGHTNIVSCDDFEAKPHKDGIGWDVFIRMELLTPLTTLIKQYAGIIPEEMVIKVGKDICLICTPFTGHPVKGVFLCVILTNLRKKLLNCIAKENGLMHPMI